MAMRLSFGEAQVLFAPYVTSQGSSDPSVAAALNFVNERFITSGEWAGNRFQVSLVCNNNVLVVPVGVESVLGVCAIDSYGNGELVRVQGDFYSFNTDGLGYQNATYAGDTQVIRLGMTSPMSRGIVTPEALVFVAGGTESSNADGVRVKGLDADGNDIWVGGQEGESWNPSVSSHTSANVFSAVTSVHVNDPLVNPWKIVGATSGIVYSQYLPWEIDPAYQMYRLVGQVPEVRTMLCLVKRGYVKLTDASQIMVPGNINAYRYGVQAYRFEVQDQLERAKVYWGMAFEALNQETVAFEEGADDVVQIQTESMLGIMNLI
jgi:hypothetical protein